MIFSLLAEKCNISPYHFHHHHHHHHHHLHHCNDSDSGYFWPPCHSAVRKSSALIRVSSSSLTASLAVTSSTSSTSSALATSSRTSFLLSALYLQSFRSKKVNPQFLSFILSSRNFDQPYSPSLFPILVFCPGSSTSTSLLQRSEFLLLNTAAGPNYMEFSRREWSPIKIQRISRASCNPICGCTSKSTGCADGS